MGGVVVRVVFGGFVFVVCWRGEIGCFIVGLVVGVG